MTDTDALSDRGSEGRGRKDRGRGNVFELRKVIWPTRNELVNYTIVVLVFVLVMAGIIAALDYIFARAVLFVFG